VRNCVKFAAKKIKPARKYSKKLFTGNFLTHRATALYHYYWNGAWFTTCCFHRLC